MTPSEKTPRPRDERVPEKQLSTPYGPHPYGVDEAAGGADSSPLDNEPTGDERVDRAEEDLEDRKAPDGRK